jgi:hypothetical protein
MMGTKTWPEEELGSKELRPARSLVGLHGSAPLHCPWRRMFPTIAIAVDAELPMTTNIPEQDTTLSLQRGHDKRSKCK